MCAVAIKINLNHMFNAGDDLHLVRLADAIVVEDAEDAEDGIADYAWLYRADMIGWEPAENAQIGSSRLFVRLLEQHGKRLHGWLSWQVQIRQLSGRAEHGCKRAAL